MFTPDISMLGFALAIDAAVATFAMGLVGVDISAKHKWLRGFVLAGTFGFFQFLMVWLGSLGGYLFTYSSYGHLFHLIVALIFFIIGAKLFQDSFDGDKKEMKWGFLSVLILALATSIDALAAGISFGTLPQADLAALTIGIITFVLCAAFYLCSNFLQNLPHNWLLRLAGSIFFILVGRIVWGYLSRSAV